MNNKKEAARTIGLAIVVGLCFLLFVFRSISIQLAEGDEYLELANAGTTITQVISAPRGEIVDRYGRALTTNQAQYNIIIDKAQLPVGGENALLLDLMELLERYGCAWEDDLPITLERPYAFSGDQEKVAALKSALGLGGYASADEVMYWLRESYLKDARDPVTGEATFGDYDDLSARRLAGVRYQMEQKEFSLTNPYTFATDVGGEISAVVRERQFELQGADIATVAAREYVDGALAPHIVGTTGLIDADEWSAFKEAGKTFVSDAAQGYRYNDYVGKTGIEKVFEEQLRGENGAKEIHLNNEGIVTSIEETQSAKAGNNVVLTINKDLQKTAYDALEARIKYLNEHAPANQGKEAEAGAAVAVDVKTGEILCMVNYPSFDISTYYDDYAALSKDPLSPLLNRATMGTYTVGSIFKPVVATAGLAAGIINAASTVYCGGRYTYYTGYHPACMGTHGNINVMDALRVSCNIFFYDVGRRLGIETMNQYASQFGLGKKTGIEIAEAAGQLSSPETREAAGDTWGPGYVLQSAIGQLDHAFTPVQIAGYVATLANNGKRMQLHLVRSVNSYDFTETVQETPITVAEQVDASAENFAVVREGMLRASYALLPNGTQALGTSYGTWGWARGKTWSEKYGRDILVASKTGTPETATEVCNGTFICYAPADDPEIAVAVVIEKGYHGDRSAPVAKAILEQYFFGSQDYDTVVSAGTLLD